MDSSSLLLLIWVQFMLAQSYPLSNCLKMSFSVWSLLRESAPGSGASGAVVGGVDAAEEAAVRTPVRCSPSNLPTLVTPGAAIPKIPQVSSSFEGKPFQLSNSVITNSTGPPLFVRYSRDFVVTVIAITEFDCFSLNFTLKVSDTQP